MNIKQKVLTFILVITASLGIGSLVVQPAFAATKCGEVETSIIGGDVCTGVKSDATTPENTGAWKLMILALNILTAGVGIAAVGGIVYGSILYASSADKADQTKKAIGIITNVVIGVIAYALMYLVLNFLIPGGIFK